MNMIAASVKQSPFAKLVGAMLGCLSRYSKPRQRPLYVNVDEFTPHLQRDMGFPGGRGIPGARSGLDAGDLKARDLMR
ncbi:hypothetical protein IHQ71_01310 [Rhizobium sp. TH2]|uniref:hypothetical protein n=1 Tax=Rhizobium sp. TH2 TaxID=2775403 RepID=UPI0021583A5D|nr:hypothetical protein [Rhizobium sp. TH2]UVC09298.1 hypothetical protein IHQ71_01310 [Rhizobium sp. TH2]